MSVVRGQLQRTTDNRLRTRFMRLPRHRFLIALALVIAVGLFFHFHVYYHFRGRLRGDAYYKGMPTNYWADCLNGDHGTPKWLKSVYAFLGARPSEGFEGGELFAADSDSAAVLLQLAAGPANSPDVRQRAIRVLHVAHKDRASDLAVVCAQIFTKESDDVPMRRSVVHALMDLVADKKTPGVDVGGLLQSSDPDVRLHATGIMWAQGNSCEAIG